MTSMGTSDEDVSDPQLAPLVASLDEVRDLVERISDEGGRGSARGADVALERHRAEVYRAMGALGAAIHEFQESGPAPELLHAAQALVSRRLREFSPTSPIALIGSQDKRHRMSYFELVEHVRTRKSGGADIRDRILDDYYIHTRIGQAFLNRLSLLTQQLIDEVDRCRASGDRTLYVINLQYVGADELLLLAQKVSTLTGLRVISLDSSSAAVRHAEQVLRPAYGPHLQVLLADPVQWLNGPASPGDTACIMYAVSLLEQLSSKRVVQALRGVYRVLRAGGTFLMGCTAGEVPVTERALRDWLLGWDWKYRSESEWRDLFSQTPFGADEPIFHYEALGVSAVVSLRRSD